MQPRNFSTDAATPESLMDRYAAGDDGVFPQLYQTTAPKLRAMLRRWTLDATEVEDILQTTFVKLVRARATYAAGEPLMPWLSVIAKRTLFDERRPLRQRFEVLTDTGTLRPRAEGPDTTPLLVRDALSRLPRQYGDAIVLTRLFGFSGSEAAMLLDTTKAAVKQRVHRGYALLRALFEGAGLDRPVAAA
jgi:RNA polymerase sigma-70 factor (ECF subfamily)